MTNITTTWSAICDMENQATPCSISATFASNFRSTLHQEATNW